MSKFISQGADSQFRDVADLAARRFPAVDPEALIARMDTHFAAIQKRNAHLLVNPRDSYLLGVCAAVLAGHQALRELPGTTDAAIRAVLAEAFVEPRRAHVGEWMESRLHITADRPDLAFDMAATHFKSGGEAFFGDSFEYRQAVQTPDTSVVQVHRCFFNNFFRANDAAELTGIFCALDIVWADELNAGPYNVRFERTAILSRGDRYCSFEFHRES